MSDVLVFYRFVFPPVWWLIGESAAKSGFHDESPACKVDWINRIK